MSSRASVKESIDSNCIDLFSIRPSAFDPCPLEPVRKKAWVQTVLIYFLYVQAPSIHVLSSQSEESTDPNCIDLFSIRPSAFDPCRLEPV